MNQHLKTEIVSKLHHSNYLDKEHLLIKDKILRLNLKTKRMIHQNCHTISTMMTLVTDNLHADIKMIK